MLTTRPKSSSHPFRSHEASSAWHHLPVTGASWRAIAVVYWSLLSAVILLLPVGMLPAAWWIPLVGPVSGLLLGRLAFPRLDKRPAYLAAAGCWCLFQLGLRAWMVPMPPSGPLPWIATLLWPPFVAWCCEQAILASAFTGRFAWPYPGVLDDRVWKPGNGMDEVDEALRRLDVAARRASILQAGEQPGWLVARQRLGLALDADPDDLQEAVDRLREASLEKRDGMSRADWVEERLELESLIEDALAPAAREDLEVPDSPIEEVIARALESEDDTRIELGIRCQVHRSPARLRETMTRYREVATRAIALEDRSALHLWGLGTGFTFHAWPGTPRPTGALARAWGYMTHHTVKDIQVAFVAGLEEEEDKSGWLLGFIWAFHLFLCFMMFALQAFPYAIILTILTMLIPVIQIFCIANLRSGVNHVYERDDLPRALSATVYWFNVRMFSIILVNFIILLYFNRAFLIPVFSMSLVSCIYLAIVFNRFTNDSRFLHFILARGHHFNKTTFDATKEHGVETWGVRSGAKREIIMRTTSWTNLRQHLTNPLPWYAVPELYVPSPVPGFEGILARYEELSGKSPLLASPSQSGDRTVSQDDFMNLALESDEPAIRLLGYCCMVYRQPSRIGVLLHPRVLSSKGQPLSPLKFRNRQKVTEVIPAFADRSLVVLALESEKPDWLDLFGVTERTAS